MDQEPQSTEVRQRFPSLLSASRGQSIYSNESRHRAAPHFPCARSSALVSLANKNRTAENLEGEVIFSLAERRSLNLPSLLPSPMSPLSIHRPTTVSTSFLLTAAVAQLMENGFIAGAWELGASPSPRFCTPARRQPFQQLSLPRAPRDLRV